MRKPIQWVVINFKTPQGFLLRYEAAGFTISLRWACSTVWISFRPQLWTLHMSTGLRIPSKNIIENDVIPLASVKVIVHYYAMRWKRKQECQKFNPTVPHRLYGRVLLRKRSTKSLMRCCTYRTRVNATGVRCGFGSCRIRFRPDIDLNFPDL